jgi:bifunctional non-homologous end joining protein LigD
VAARKKKQQLDRYAEKRTFTKTPEPGPKLPSGRQGPLLFVVQKHAARRLHYDFRLELDGVLKSWAVPKGPSLVIGEKRLAVEVEDHPFDYASFEGVIPEKQYGAGNVIIWDCGVYSPDEGQQYAFDDRESAEARVRKELEQGKLSFFMRGEKLKGSFALVRTSSDKQWLLLKHKDRFAGADDLLAHNASVISSATLDTVGPLKVAQQLESVRLAPNGSLEKMPAKVAPMLAEAGEAARSEPGWTYEPKMDGYRVIAHIDAGEVRLTSRRGIDLTPFFPEITAELAQQAVGSMLLDGEIVALDAEGRPSFNALQNRAQLKTVAEIVNAQRTTPVVMVCFDLLHFAGLNLRGATYSDRRRYLMQCLLPSAHVQLVHTSNDAEKLYEASLASGFEGIVAKRNDSIYQPGKRAAAWLKIKAIQTGDFVVGGVTQGRGTRASLGALLLGYWAGNKLQYAGHVGSGLNHALLDELETHFAKLSRKTSPFTGDIPLHRPTRWVEPKTVVEVSYAEWTPDKLLRAPVFMRVRDDINPRAVKKGPPVVTAAKKAKTVRKAAAAKAPAKTSPMAPTKTSAKTRANDVDAIVQQLDGNAQTLDLIVGDAKVHLTNLDRIYWPATRNHPAVTKRDHLRYLAGVGRFMLPHLADRPLTMIRMPSGIDGERFFQKHWEQSMPDFVDTITVYSDHKSEQHAYIVCSNLPTLLWLGQNGTLEFHVWHSRAKLAADAASKLTDYSSSLEALESSVLNFPDYLVFDLDPYVYSGKEAKGAEPEFNKKGFAMGRRVAFWLRDLLKEMGLKALVKTSGKTGLHVFVPIDRTVTFTEARHLCEMVGRHLLREHPKEITMEWATEKRTGKIFIDYNMNVRGKTLNVAYSPRGVPGAPVSMPLTWDELEAADPFDFRIENVLPRLERVGDRWHDALSIKQSLAKAFGSIGRT